MIEVPRLVKKPGEYKRVDTLQELEAALADGWVLRLEPAAAAPETPPGDVPPVSEPEAVEPESEEPATPDLASVLTADLERQADLADTVAEPAAESDSEQAEEPNQYQPESEPPKRKPGRPRKS